MSAAPGANNWFNPSSGLQSFSCNSTMLEPLHSVWLCSQLTAKPPDVRDYREHRRKTILLKLPTQHTSTATADNGRQSTYLTLGWCGLKSSRNDYTTIAMVLFDLPRNACRYPSHACRWLSSSEPSQCCQQKHIPLGRSAEPSLSAMELSVPVS